MEKNTIKDINLENKTILMRVDFNVPIKEQNGEVVVTNDNRITAALPTIKYALDNNSKIVLFSHLGRVKSEDDKKKLSMKPVAKRLSELLDKEIIFSPDFEGPALENKIKELKNKQILVVENTRFADVKNNEIVNRESKNDPELGRYWASLGDVFINDAFGTVHRAHASNVGIANNMTENAVGFLIEKEIKFLGNAVNKPKRPFVAIIGGAKVSDKINIIENLLNKADKVIVGGGMAYTFKAAEGKQIGNSLFEEDKMELAKNIMNKFPNKLILPIDNIEANEFSNNSVAKIVGENIEDGYMGLDIGPKSIDLFNSILDDAKTVVWNGPMGVFEMSKFAEGTLAVGKKLADITKNNGTITIVGGGDSTAAVQQLNVADDLSHISTGGGASLQYLEGKVLPGLEAISNK